MIREGAYTIRPATTDDREAILATFNLVFAEDNPAFEPRSAEIWDWTFPANPAGMQVYVAMTDDGTCAAQFASVPNRVRLRGKEVLFGQIVDSFAHPDHRAGLKRPGLWVSTAQPMVAHFGDPERNVVMYGFPVPHAFRIGQRFLGYHVIRTQNYLALDGGAAWDGDAGLVDEVSGFGDEAGALFERVCPPKGAMAIRDEAFLTWRFTDNPLYDYSVGVVAGSDGAWRAMAVFRCGTYTDTSQGLIVDWMVEEGDDEAARALVAWAQGRAKEGGENKVGVSLADCDPWWVPLQEAGLRVARTKYDLVGGNFVRRFTPDWLRHRWQTTLADTDLV